MTKPPFIDRKHTVEPAIRFAWIYDKTDMPTKVGEKFLGLHHDTTRGDVIEIMWRSARTHSGLNLLTYSDAGPRYTIEPDAWFPIPEIKRPK